MLQKIARENPEVYNAMNTINKLYNGNGRAAFMDAAKKKGMTEQQIKDFLDAIK